MAPKTRADWGAPCKTRKAERAAEYGTLKSKSQPSEAPPTLAHPATFPAAVPDGVTLNTAVVAAPPARGTGELTSPLAPTLVTAVVAASSATRTGELTPPLAPTLGTDAALATVVAAPPRRVRTLGNQWIQRLSETQLCSVWCFWLGHFPIPACSPLLLLSRAKPS